jgi:trk system potassium uptake protein TrkA
MRVVIVGAGEVGYHLADRLSQENQDVVVIEADPQRAEQISDHLDVMTIVGNGAAIPNLEKARVDIARMMLAVTSQDEVNLIASLAAKKMGAKQTIARISNPEYYSKDSALPREQLGIDLMINPERECAKETFGLLSSPAATDVASFHDDRVQLIGMIVREGAPVAGKTLAEIGQELIGRHYIVTGIVHEGSIKVPTGEDRIEAGDHVYLISPTEEVAGLAPLAGHEPYKLRRIMIAGGSPEAVYLAEICADNGVEVTLLDSSRQKCIELAERLPKALVLNGDATDLDLLDQEGVAGMDGYLAATGSDDTNILSSLLAKQAGARKVVSLITDFDYLSLGTKVGIDATVSPRMSAVNAILRHVRRGRVSSLAILKGIDAEAIQFSIGASTEVANRAIADLHLPKGCVIGTIFRDDQIIVPRGKHRVEPGDEVLVFALPGTIEAVEQAFG